MQSISLLQTLQEMESLETHRRHDHLYCHHLSKQHTKVYETTIQVKGLKHANMSPHASQTSNSSINLNAPFSIEKFLDLLQRWVVIDDQSIHILECPEFCDLMLYLGAGKIDDKDLPHHHK
ncbi:hypothetical protein CPB84DRAFT_1750912 [Gymnopilus junonius]|uniref:Uncharacterized protein n=1 Tax=Gymnopilus junonius TaxID=109634 RepID=A0A9P5THQ6_GYMJU|nr:hypothetical protein CPB84DRAFT_1750912 [Gymnopilus junonius]